MELSESVKIVLLVLSSAAFFFAKQLHDGVDGGEESSQDGNRGFD